MKTIASLTATSLVALLLTLGYLLAAAIGIVLLLAHAVIVMWFTVIAAYTGG